MALDIRAGDIGCGGKADRFEPPVLVIIKRDNCEAAERRAIPEHLAWLWLFLALLDALGIERIAPGLADQ